MDQVSWFVGLFILVILFMTLAVAWVLSHMAGWITGPINLFYKSLRNIITHQQSGSNDKEENFNLILDYQPRNEEMNTLYLNVSEMAKALRLARFSAIDDYRHAMLNYHALADIFNNYSSTDNLSGCHNNIACIYL